MEIKHFTLSEVKADAEAFTFSGYASTFGNVDSQKDIVLPGAFTKTLRERGAQEVLLLWQHDQREPIGRPSLLREDSKGLYIEGAISRTDTGIKAHTLLKDGVIKKMSMGYIAKQYDIDRKTGIRSLKEVELFEVSFVTFPANDQADITQVKSRPQTIREFEERLREGGFSHQEATTVALHGFKALDRGEPDEQVLESIYHMFNRITAI